MGVSMYLYAQLIQTKNKQCKSAIILLQCYHPHLSDFWLFFQVQIHSIIIFITSQDLVYFNHITSNMSIFKSLTF